MATDSDGDIHGLLCVAGGIVSAIVVGLVVVISIFTGGGTSTKTNLMMNPLWDVEMFFGGWVLCWIMFEISTVRSS